MTNTRMITAGKKPKANQNLYTCFPPKAFNDLAYCKQTMADVLIIKASCSVVVQVALDHYAKHLEGVVQLQRRDPGEKQVTAILDSFNSAAHCIADQRKEASAFRLDEYDYHLQTRDEVHSGNPK